MSRLQLQGTSGYPEPRARRKGRRSDRRRFAITLFSISRELEGRILLSTAVDDLFVLPENTSFSVNNPFDGVLGNDTLDNSTDRAVLGAGPTHGSLQLNGDGTFTYIPSPNYSGNDSFTYFVRTTLGADSNTATVNLTINAVNEFPVANDDSYYVNEDAGLNASSVLANDVESDGTPPPTASLVQGPVHAQSFAINANGTFAYTPVANFNGTDIFKYRAIDSSGNLSSTVATVTITVVPVSDPPVGNPDAFTSNEDEVLSVAAPGVLGNDTDTDVDASGNRDRLSAFLVTSPSHGTINLNSDGSFSYTPNANYNGLDSFFYQASDGTNLSPPVEVTLTVRPLNDAPVARDDTATTPENVPVNVTVLANDTDTDGDALTAVVVNQPLHGTVVPGPGGTLTYTPAAGYSGTDTYTYRASDGTLSSEIATVSVFVAEVNVAPTTNGDAFSVNEDTALVVAAPGVLGNDTDSENGALSAFLISGPTHGAVTFNANGSFTYTPAPNYNGPDSFTYQASDGQLLSGVTTVSINVRPVDSVPVANNDSFTVLEDLLLAVPAPGLLLNDLNSDGGTPAITVFNGPFHGTLSVDPNGSFNYQPFPNYFGPDSFTYFLTTNGLNSNVATVAIQVLPVADKPVANPNSYTTNEGVALVVSGPGVLANDLEVDGQALRAVLIDGPSNGSVLLNSDGSFTYTTDTAFNGTDTFTYIAVNASLASDPTTVTIRVRSVNVAPVARDDHYATEEDETLTVPVPGVLGNDSDADPGDTLRTVLVNPPQRGSLTLNSNGSFVYNPALDFSGTDTFTYRASDGTLSGNLATVTITVIPIATTTVMLDPRSDTGASSTDRITNDGTPTFVGTTRANLEVRLFARPAGSTLPPGVVGAAFADSSGNYVVTSSALPDGEYVFSVAAFRADGTTTGTIQAGPLTVDTVAPVVTDAFLNPKNGQVYVTFQDDRVGMAQATIGNINNYSFDKLDTTHNQRLWAPYSVQVQPAGAPTSPQTAIVNVFRGTKLKHGTYRFVAISGGIADVAGNALSGEFFGSYPSGNGGAAGNFNAQFVTDGLNVTPATPADQFVPILSPQSTPTVRVTQRGSRSTARTKSQPPIPAAKAAPSGPLALSKGKGRRRAGR